MLNVRQKLKSSFTPAFLALGLALLPTGTQAMQLSQKEALAEVERQLEAWRQDGRTEDIIYISKHQKAVIKQVKAGKVDLQAIVDQQNDKHNDRQVSGQKTPEQSSAQTSEKQRSADNAAAKADPVAQKTATSATVPDNNHPLAAYTYLKSSWQGFPATRVQKAKQAYLFPNGYVVSCANWDPRTLDPTPASVGRAVKNCDVSKTIPKGKKTKGFKKGEPVDIAFGNVSAAGRDYGLSSGSTISGSTLRMTKDGRIAVGKFNAFSVSTSGGDGAGGGTRKLKLRGTYHLDNHLITINTEDGQTHVGFVSWTSNKGSQKIDHIYLNGEHFWDRSS